MLNNRKILQIGIGCMFLFLVGCERASKNNITNIKEEHMKNLKEKMRSFKGVLDINKAVAMAIKNNLDRQTAFLESIMTKYKNHADFLENLPAISKSLNYNYESPATIHSNVTNSGIKTGYGNSIANINLGLNLNTLDLSNMFISSKINSAQLAMKNQMHRKAMNLAARDAILHYYRSAALQDIEGETQSMISSANDIVNRCRKLAAERIQDPIQMGNYAQDLLERMRLANTTVQNLIQDRIQLKADITAPFDQDIKVESINALQVNFKKIDFNMEKLIERAIKNNPEIDIKILNGNVDKHQISSLIAKAIPIFGLEPGMKAQMNVDSGLDLSSITGWGNIAFTLSSSLFKIFSLPGRIKQKKAQGEINKHKEMALILSTILQVRLACAKLNLAIDDFKIARDLYYNSAKIADHYANMDKMRSDVDKIIAQSKKIYSKVQMNDSLSNVYVSLANLYSVIGEDLVVDPNRSIDELAKEVAKKFHNYLNIIG